VSKADTSLFVPKKKIGDGEREAFALAVEFEADAVWWTIETQQWKLNHSWYYITLDNLGSPCYAGP